MFEMQRTNINEIKRNKFFKMPKWLFEEEKYSDLSNDCKVAYMLLKDRNELSLKNAEEHGTFIDENGDVYFIYSAIELGNILKKSGKTVTKIKRELINAQLLEEKRMGRGMANRYYLLEPVLDLRNVKTTLHRDVKITLLETENLRPNNTNINKTDNNKTDTFVNKEKVTKSSSDELINIANSFYTTFAVGRWSKEEWNTMVEQFVEELIKEQRVMKNKKAYIYGAIEQMAYHHDFKRGKINMEQNPDVPSVNYSKL